MNDKKNKIYSLSKFTLHCLCWKSRSTVAWDEVTRNACGSISCPKYAKMFSAFDLLLLRFMIYKKFSSINLWQQNWLRCTDTIHTQLKGKMRVFFPQMSPSSQIMIFNIYIWNQIFEKYTIFIQKFNFFIMSILVCIFTFSVSGQINTRIYPITENEQTSMEKKMCNNNFFSFSMQNANVSLFTCTA